MNRFLRYATEHEAKIRTVFLQEGKPVQKTVHVIAYDDKTITLTFGKKTVTIPRDDLLACDYARGDNGENN